MASNDKINAIIWILKKHPEKSRDWAEEQLQRAVDNYVYANQFRKDLQEPITAKQYAEILKLEFGV
jgi:type I restriction-modification system DNA methylase subunit|tara:strand:+ start:109 stop:306 length:198 start_codon:yes stop_codon:yes gene_type:complete